jgi:hypothetical protein
MGNGICFKIAGYVDLDMLPIFGNLNLTCISYSFWNIVLKFKKFDEKEEITPKMGNQIYFKIAQYVDLDMLKFFAI